MNMIQIYIIAKAPDLTKVQTGWTCPKPAHDLGIHWPGWDAPRRPTWTFGHVLLKSEVYVIYTLIGEFRTEAARQKAIQMRLDFAVQAHECYEDWCKRVVEAYHTILRYPSPQFSVQVVGIETSQVLWTNLEERYPEQPGTRRILRSY
ncbi:hypothetical protein BBP40_002272 [Aspergillus hancockii]|nr:hypothetical protein BBP40_002272 [Aspergillus hancockii]